VQGVADTSIVRGIRTEPVSQTTTSGMGRSEAPTRRFTRGGGHPRACRPLALDAGEAAGNRLCSVLLSALLPQTNVCSGSWAMTRLDQGVCPPAGRMGKHRERAAQTHIAFSQIFTRAKPDSNGSLTRSTSKSAVATRYDQTRVKHMAFVK